MQVNLPRLILELRADLCHRFGFNLPERSDDYLSWLLTSGLREYRALQDDPASLQGLVSRCSHTTFYGLTILQTAVYYARPDVQSVFALPRMRQQFLQWFWSHGVGECSLWSALTPAEKRTALRVAQITKSPWLKQLTALAQANRPVSQIQSSALPAALPFGVNVIGYVFGQLGIGEDLRMTARSLQAAKIPFCIVNFSSGHDIALNDLSLARHVLPDGQLGTYAINLFCMTPLETGRYYAMQGGAQWRGRYTIGYWPWELSRWPQQFELVYPLVDEVWVSTTHTQDALMSSAHPPLDKPVKLMPLVVAPESRRQKLRAPEARHAIRRRFRLPIHAKLFCFSFDLNSSIQRKNPQSCIQAFLRAFPKTEWSRLKVGMVIKTHALRTEHREYKKLKMLAAQDNRIHIIEGTLPRPELMAFYAACDVFVSLHRAEGFGRALAEALQLGLHLIATDYSGNTDFCRRPEFKNQVSLIPYRLIKVRKGQYPYAEGQVWANPSIAAAAKAMRDFVGRPNSSYKVPRGGWPVFKASILGQRYRDRLEEIYQMYKHRNKEQ